MKAQGAIAAEATSEASLTGQNVAIEGKVKADVKGAQTTVAGQMSVLQGAAFKVQVI
ncbi:MAG: hypothetical protein JXR39_04330 [Marinilabiliaceae bacterium]|nr:hypothetical protein [Marinilabiliaceae bacterium]